MKLGRFETNKIYNEDCYKAIKELPDKCIDLVYIDIPYLFDNHGKGTSELAQRMSKKDDELIDIQDGIDYGIFDELCRIMKHTYIYIYGVAKNKFRIL